MKNLCFSIVVVFKLSFGDNVRFLRVREAQELIFHMYFTSILLKATFLVLNVAHVGTCSALKMGGHSLLEWYWRECIQSASLYTILTEFYADWTHIWFTFTRFKVS